MSIRSHQAQSAMLGYAFEFRVACYTVRSDAVNAVAVGAHRPIDCGCSGSPFLFSDLTAFRCSVDLGLDFNFLIHEFAVLSQLRDFQTLFCISPLYPEISQFTQDPADSQQGKYAANYRGSSRRKNKEKLRNGISCTVKNCECGRPPPIGHVVIHWRGIPKYTHNDRQRTDDAENKRKCHAQRKRKGFDYWCFVRFSSDFEISKFKMCQDFSLSTSSWRSLPAPAIFLSVDRWLCE